MCLHLFTRSSHTGKQTRIATLCKSIGHQARCPKPFTPRCKEDPDVAPRNQWKCITTQQHGGYPIRALSSPCFLFFRPFFCWRLLGLIPGGTPFSQLNKGVRDAMSATTKRDVEHQVSQKHAKGHRYQQSPNTGQRMQSLTRAQRRGLR